MKTKLMICENAKECELVCYCKKHHPEDDHCGDECYEGVICKEVKDEEL